MPSAKSSSVPRRNKIGNWGGGRKGAGRKRELELSDRREIAGDHFACMQKRLGSVAGVVEERRVKERRRRLMTRSVARVAEERCPFREALIRELMAEYKVTHRMVVRCVAEFLPDIRWNAKMYKYAVEGAVIRPLPARTRNMNKLRPGVYVQKNLRLNVDSPGKRTWIFQYRWGSTIHNMVLGGPEISLTKARELAIKTSRKLAAGQNPMNDSS
jgi:Arm domain-containing DNA-binding protein